MLEYIVILGAIIQIIGTSFYIKDTLKGKTKPNRVTWFLWGIPPLIATAAAFSDGVRWAAVPVLITGFTPMLIFIASFVNKKAYGKLGTFDYLCGAFSILALVLWGITNNPVIAIILAIIADIFAAIPTIIKSWTNPETETIHEYIASTICFATSFFALRTYSTSELAFPIYMIILNIALIVIIYDRRRTNTQTH